MEREANSNLTMEDRNLIIICLGLGMLIIPVICAMVWVCVHKRVFQHMKIVTLKTNGSSEDTIFPYSKFPSAVSDEGPTLAITVPKDVRVLVYAENSKTKKSVNQQNHRVSSHRKPYVITDDVYCGTPTFNQPYAPPSTLQSDVCDADKIRY